MVFEGTGQEVPFKLVSNLMWGVGVGAYVPISFCQSAVFRPPPRSRTLMYEAVPPGSEETRAASLSADPILIELVYFSTNDLIILHPDKASPAPTWPGWM